MSAIVGGLWKLSETLTFPLGHDIWVSFFPMMLYNFAQTETPITSNKTDMLWTQKIRQTDERKDNTTSTNS